MSTPKKTAAKKAPAKTVATEDKSPAKIEPPVDAVLEVKKQEPQEQIKAPAEDVVDDTPLEVLAKDAIKNVANPEKKVLFVSKNKDCNSTIHAGGVAYAPTFDDTKSFLIWKVDRENADFFAEHTFVKFGKVVRALGK